MNLPEGALPVTSDRELYKTILEKGNSKNRSANYCDTLVGVYYILLTEDGSKLEHRAESDPVCWIVGDSESENDVYPFLISGVRTMCEGETAKFFFTKKYFLGNTIYVRDGVIDNSNYFSAIVKLVKSVPYDQIQEENEKAGENKKEEIKSDNVNQETNNDEIKQEEENIQAINDDNNKENEQVSEDNSISNQKQKIVEVEDDEQFKRKKFALRQLQIAEDLLRAGKPAQARKEYNRARLAWGNQIDYNKAPEILSHEALDLSKEEIRKYVESHAQYGVARTFLECTPPNKERAVSILREIIAKDKDFLEPAALLESLGQKVEETEFPEFGDHRLHRQDFWMDDSIDWKRRIEFNLKANETAGRLFKENRFKDALTMYGRSVLSFSGQGKKDLPPEQRSEMNSAIILSKLNALACYIKLNEMRKVLLHSQELLDIIAKIEDNNKNVDYSSQKVKCLYRKALAHHILNQTDYVEETIKMMAPIEGSKDAINAIRIKQKEDQKRHVQDQDFMYSKMTGTLK